LGCLRSKLALGRSLQARAGRSASLAQAQCLPTRFTSRSVSFKETVLLAHCLVRPRQRLDSLPSRARLPRDGVLPIAQPACQERGWPSSRFLTTSDITVSCHFATRSSPKLFIDLPGTTGSGAETHSAAYGPELNLPPLYHTHQSLTQI